MQIALEHIDEVYRCLTSTAMTQDITSVQRYEGQPFKVLLASILSTQTREEMTVKASELLLGLADNPYDMATKSQEEIRSAINSVSFYNVKARHIIKVCARLIANGGIVPQTLDELLAFEGVGWKVAVLTLAIGYGNDEHICVDTHVARIAKRLGLVDSQVSDPKMIGEALKQVLPRPYWKSWNGLMVLFGREVCKFHQPLCTSCCIEHLCPKIDLS